MGAAVVLLLGATGVLFMKYRKASADFVNMQAAEETARNRYAQTIDAIAEIQDSLNAIALGDENVKMLSQDLQRERSITGPDGRETLDRIALLRASIARNKVRINQLESSLEKSGMKVAGLEKMVNRLKSTVSEKEGLIAHLATQVDSLQTQVTGLAAEVEEKQETIVAQDQTIEEKRSELATVYYAVGSKKELSDQGLIEARGGVLGLGKTLQPSGHFTQSAFVPLDTDQQTVLTIPAPKARVLSAQPPGSYELRDVGDRVELHILDPREFRKVRQLVILTA
jgi:septal ring factor EnvC (AmiA/AmiB activator)